MAAILVFKPAKSPKVGVALYQMVHAPEDTDE